MIILKIKSLFKKQILFYVIIIIGITVLFTALTSVVYRNDYIARKEESLITHGENISKEYQSLHNGGIVNYEAILYEIRVLKNTDNADVFIIGSDGTVYITSDGSESKWIGVTVTNEVVSEILKGNVVTVKDENLNMFSEPVLAVGYPIIAGDNLNGGILMCVSMPEIEESVSSVFQTALKLMIIVSIIVIFLLYIFTRRITKPLVEMNEAAKIIADGNFDKRVAVSGEDEIGQLGESFNNMADSLEKQEILRRNFIANVSHDLRSPLTSIGGYVNAMLDGTIPEESYGKYLGIVSEEVDRLSKITNDIVALSSAQTSPLDLNLERFDINELIRDTVRSFDKTAADKKMYLKLILEEKETFVLADRDKIQRVLYNLLDNAFKFTPDEGQITVEISSLENQKVLVSVEDTGIGIPEEDKKYVFNRFYKTDSSRGMYKESGGLGLSIAREFINAHGESIGIVKSDETGTKFLFTLKKAEE